MSLYLSPFLGNSLASGQFVNYVPANIQLGNLAQWIAAGIAFAALLLAAVSARWAAKQWRLQYFTKEWANTLQFLFEHPEFLDPEKNRNYTTAYQDNDTFKYNLIARLSIGYVDDLYHLRTGKYLKSWLRGSVNVFVTPHQKWFEDNRNAYDPKFVTVMECEMAQDACKQK